MLKLTDAVSIRPLSYGISAGYEKRKSGGYSCDTGSNGRYHSPINRIDKPGIGVHIGIAFDRQFHIQDFLVVYDSLDKSLIT